MRRFSLKKEQVPRFRRKFLSPRQKLRQLSQSSRSRTVERTTAGTSGSDPDTVHKDIDAEKTEIYELMLEVKMMKALESTLTKERDK